MSSADYVMKSRHRFRSESVLAPATLTLLAAGVTPLAAQVRLPPLQFEESEKQGYFVRLGPRIAFNIEAKVESAAQTPQQAGFYDNGFVQPDQGGSGSGLTWNWGYDDNAQVNGDFIDYQRYSNVPRGGLFSSGSDDPLLGGEVMAGVEFGRFAVGEREFSWGAEIGYSFTPFKVSNRSTATGTVNYLAASHALNGVVPPVAPYQGTPEGPGPLIDLTPSSTSSLSGNATSNFDGTLESDLHLMKIGLWIEAPLSTSLAASLSLGYCSVFADTRFDFQETIGIDNPGIPGIAPANVSTSASDWQGGFYAQLRGTWQFSTHWGAFAAADYQFNDQFEFSSSGRDVTLDFQSTYGASLGLIFSW
jgi:hypothetical protein